MKRTLLFCVLGTLVGCGPATHKPQLAYPPSERTDVVDTIHGHAVPDPYRWLEDVADPRTQTWMKRQTALFHYLLKKRSPNARAAYAKRLTELAYLDTVTPPSKRGNRYFYTRRHRDKEKAIWYWKEGPDGEERVLLDPHTFSADGSTSLGAVSITLDGKTVAFSKRLNNADEGTAYVMDVATGTVSDIDVIPGFTYTSASFTPDGKSFYYTHMGNDPKIPPDQRAAYAPVKQHVLGTDPRTDKIIYPALGDPKKGLSIGISRDGRWLIIGKYEGVYNDVEILDKQNEKLGFRTLVAGKKARYELYAWRDKFYIRTNENAAKYKVVKLDPTKSLNRDTWVDLVPERDDATLQGMQIVGDHLVLRYLKNATTRIEVRTLDGKMVREVKLPGLGSASGFWGLPDEDEAYYYFSSFTIPTTIFKTSVANGGADVWDKVKVDVDPTPYEVKQVWYPSKDGTKVSMFIVHKKGIALDGSHPVYMTGYGGFTVTLTPSFSRFTYPWLENGGIFAMPNLRGGGEYGEEWHKAGMREKKQNVFDDFHAAAEFLIKEGYTRRDKLAVQGGSNGGLLMGAVITQRPDLYGAILCSAPLLDMIRYHKVGVGRFWIPEYGDPDDPKDFEFLMKYSPYHNITAGTSYPALLMLSPAQDDRVDPMHARKFIAAMQHAQGGDAPILIRVETKAGHGGGGVMSAHVDKYADIYAFLTWQLGLGD